VLLGVLLAIYVFADFVFAFLPNREPAIVVVRLGLVAMLLVMLIFGPQTLRFVEIAPTGIRYIPMFYIVYGPMGFIGLLVYAVPTPKPNKAIIVCGSDPTQRTLTLNFKYGKPKVIGIRPSVAIEDVTQALSNLGVPVESAIR